MIKSKADLKEYLEADKKNLGRVARRPSLFDTTWKFEIALRNLEYYSNIHSNPISKFMKLFWRCRHRLLEVICGFEIPINVFGKGLSIAHSGNIIVNPYARIGENCRIHVGVNIGTAAGQERRVPKIGNNVYIAPGVKIFGDIEIANGIAIGANAVVCKSFLEENITIAGVPAKQISNKGSKGLMNNYMCQSGEPC